MANLAPEQSSWTDFPVHTSVDISNTSVDISKAMTASLPQSMKIGGEDRKSHHLVDVSWSHQIPDPNGSIPYLFIFAPLRPPHNW